jgi:hypothetical protein
MLAGGSRLRKDLVKIREKGRSQIDERKIIEIIGMKSYENVNFDFVHILCTKQNNLSHDLLQIRGRNEIDLTSPLCIHIEEKIA